MLADRTPHPAAFGCHLLPQGEKGKTLSHREERQRGAVGVVHGGVQGDDGGETVAVLDRPPEGDRPTPVVPDRDDRTPDAEFVDQGAEIRDAWWATAGTPANSSYINFAHGDEALDVIYGDSLSRLQQLKGVYDPDNRFNQWFPLVPRT